MNGWWRTTLGEVARVAGGGTPSTTNERFWGGPITWLTPTEVVRADGRRISSSERTITHEGLEGSSAKLLPKNTILLTSRASVGYVAIADTELATNQGFQSLVPGDAVLPEWLMYWVQANREEFLARASGSTFPEISAKKVRAIPVIIPPLDVQRRIVDLVGALDDNIAALEAEFKSSWSAHRRLRAALFTEAPSTPLSGVCGIRGGLVDPRDPRFSDLPHIGIDVIEKETGRVLGERTAREDALISGKYLVDPRDVVYAKVRPNLQKVAAYGSQALCSADAYPLRPVEGLPPTLLREALLVEPVLDHVVTLSARTGMPKVNRGELFSVEVPLGEPALWEAHDAVLRSSRELAVCLLDETDHLRELRGSILPALLSGEVEIPESYDTLFELQEAA